MKEVKDVNKPKPAPAPKTAGYPEKDIDFALRHSRYIGSQDELLERMKKR